MKEGGRKGERLGEEEGSELSENGSVKCYITLYVNVPLFSLCLRGQDFDFGERYQVDYSLYLHFDQRYSVCTPYIHVLYMVCTCMFFIFIVHTLYMHRFHFVDFALCCRIY